MREWPFTSCTVIVSGNMALIVPLLYKLCLLFASCTPLYRLTPPSVYQLLLYSTMSSFIGDRVVHYLGE